ncbi:MAG TPA: hypothetical protein VFB45_01310 [Pseudolabrys sp.]|nr:hypothetical protein [Pseudolabrys sp.]
MQSTHVPSLGPRYWTALCLASIFGANMGDFFAHDLGLGHVAGLPFLAAAFAVVVIVERFDRLAHEAYYWLAIVIVRTAATNSADFLCGDLKLPRPWVIAGLAVVLAAIVSAAWQLIWRQTDAMGRANGPLRADSGYWLAMFTAGTLGTVIGDYASHNLRLGNTWASIWLSLPLACLFIVGHHGLMSRLTFYWLIISMVRAAGTSVGDLFAQCTMLGLATSTLVTGLVFVATLALWRTSAGSARLASR